MTLLASFCILLLANNVCYLLQRAAMSDFDRFKLRKARQRRNKVRTEAFYRIRKAASRDGSLFGKKCIAKSKVKPRPKAAAKAAAKPAKAPAAKPAAKK